ncbi:hypothetical protein [Mycobacterium sp. 236(2023)]|uniref:hypothetical protein n=1 Tax=Mycobacterium sp. 236(2023) TaxID=3038163 RepID=UPI0024156365|nr:hypothetical protein [Mycobacterium sp. 236(2023)]MDG4669354.1 hypothetical protein [Mycobacterium sp. 236(2023)]
MADVGRERRQNLAAVGDDGEVTALVGDPATAKSAPSENDPWVAGERAALIYGTGADPGWEDELRAMRLTGVVAVRGSRMAPSAPAWQSLPTRMDDDTKSLAILTRVSPLSR